VLLTVSAPVGCVPLGAWAPDHAPEAVQPVTFVPIHARLDALPLATVVGFAVNVSVGAGGGAVSVTVTEREIGPPGPEQSRLNVLLMVSAPVDCVPLTAWAPDHAPDAVQPVTFVPIHARLDALPLATVIGFAVNVSVGAGAVPPVPNAVDLNAQPSPPPEAISQAAGLPPPAAPTQTPTNPCAGISGLVVQRAPEQTEMS
jgi:hypothetical protein